ncbi:ATPase domain-containing protein [Cytobacillus gottheilii]|uniref:ATPase domain-containing protein n=1 Tax=Cytobacillus gottheilii TaxID=859144 RepID=UPI0009BC268E|nr:ATPase domain-containing protein [Cytobacillus gottheilii]
MSEQDKVATGITGLDEVLYGGLPAGSISLIQGSPGTGKTTLGLQFLIEGARKYNEAGIYITFEELPEQLYRDSASFGWDLKDLEKNNLLRVICIQPEVLIDHITKPNGLLENVIKTINCKRIVLDSVSLYRVLNTEAEARNKVYLLRNVFKKWGLTTLLINEIAGLQNPLEQNSFENYLSDGVIHLSLSKFMDKYRSRQLEILKMRGTKIVEGEHRFKFLDHGIHVIPALSMAEDKLIIKNSSDTISTGIQTLDDILSGGLQRGTTFTIDTNSKANYRYIVTALLAKRLEAGDKLISMMTNTSTIDTISFALSEYGICLNDLIKEQKAYFVDLFKRDIPVNSKQYHSGIIQITDFSEEGFRKQLQEKFSDIIQTNLASGGNWFVYYDLNVLISLLGISFTQRFFAEEALRCRLNGITMLAHINFAEISQAAGSVFERASNGIIRTWVDGNYQLLQVTKSPTGRMSAPHIIENIDEKPFLRLI